MIRIEENISLKPYHTFGMNVNTRYFAEYETVEDLIREDEDKLAFLYDYKQVIINYAKVLQQSLPAFLNEKFKLLLQRVNASNIPNSKW